MRNSVLMLVVLLGICGPAYGQMFPERRHIRKGNRLYEEQRMDEAQKSYREALQRQPNSVEATFNLGDSQYAKGEYEAAESTFADLLESDKVDDNIKAKAYFNRGNAQFQQQKLSEALESFKESLRLNPADLEAKYNYAYTKKLIEQQENNQNQQQDQQQQNQDQNKDQNQDQNSNNNDDEQQPEQPEQPEGDKPDPSEGSEPRPEEGPSPESEQLLNAVQAAEDKTREKIDAEKAVGVARSGKNW
ncbi:MAG: tetratricopeptide repeat protein [Tidjanibacter sp.]|nr:tetratricopeptide repeat protein [Tidjanibacter sp.]